MARKKGAKFQGVVAKFQLQLGELLAVVESSETHFVRCIKPNMVKSGTSWDSETVTKQLTLTLPLTLPLPLTLTPTLTLTLTPTLTPTLTLTLTRHYVLSGTQYVEVMTADTRCT